MKKLRLKISLKHIDPEIYRIIEVPDDINFKELHHAIQCIFDWDDTHPYEFIFDKIGVKVRKSTDYDYSSEYKILKRRTLIGELLEEGESCSYIYNLSAYWDHKIECLNEFNSFDHSIRISEYQGDNISEEIKGINHFKQLLRTDPAAANDAMHHFDIIATQKLLNRFTDIHASINSR